MLKGYLPAIIIALLCHAFLLALLYSQKIPSYKVTPPAKKAIKSYLYIRPQTQVPEHVTKRIMNEENMLENKQKTEPKTPPIKAVKAINTPEKPVELTEKAAAVENVKPAQKESQSDKLTTEPVKAAAPTASPTSAPAPAQKKEFSAVKQLGNLRSALNRQISEQYFNQYKQHQSLSGMHPSPEAVPHANVQLSAEEIKKKNTTRLSNDIAITKNDNGTCSIEQDLSNVGMEGVSATSFFACGESAFDKSFREHMKKVQAKLAKPK